MTIKPYEIVKLFFEGVQIEKRRRIGKALDLEIENSSVSDWYDMNKLFPDFNFVEYEYQVKETNDSIDWSHVNPKYNYMARDANDDFAYFYEAKPEWSDSIENWRTPSGTTAADGAAFSSYKMGTCSPENSLVSRY